MIMNPEIDKQYLESLERIYDLFSRGRPLVRDALDSVYSRRRSFTFENYVNKNILRASELTVFIRENLLPRLYKLGSSGIYLSDPIKFSILGFSTGLSSFPSNVKIEELVENNLMTLLNVDNNNQNQVGGFFPEGPLNGIASWYLCKMLS